MDSSVSETTRPTVLKAIPGALRLHHWLKNLLVFTPLVAAHRFSDAAAWSDALVVFVVFCFCSSSVYLFNDWVDRASDREHPVKRLRPIAAGHLSRGAAFSMMVVLLAAGLVIAAAAGTHVLLAVVFYCAVSVLYTLYIKRIILADVAVLVTLYLVRLVAGALATGVVLSHWLIAFAVFAFANLAFAKRVTEIHDTLDAGDPPAPVRGRGYLFSHVRMLRLLAFASALMSVAVLAFYAVSGTAASFYGSPGLLWVPAVLWAAWLTRLWTMSASGRLSADPVVFALCDRTSLALILVSFGFLWAAI